MPGLAKLGCRINLSREDGNLKSNGFTFSFNYMNSIKPVFRLKLEQIWEADFDLFGFWNLYVALSLLL